VDFACLDQWLICLLRHEKWWGEIAQQTGRVFDHIDMSRFEATLLVGSGVDSLNFAFIRFIAHDSVLA
jgi:hypothetical protein